MMKLTAEEQMQFAWAKDRSKPKTEQDVERYLAVNQYPGKYATALERAHIGEWYWNEVVDYYLALGGLLTSQLYNNGSNPV